MIQSRHRFVFYVYVTSMAGKAIYALSVPELKQTAKIDVGRFPNWITINPRFGTHSRD